MLIQNKTKVHGTPLVIHGWADDRKTVVLASAIQDGQVQDFRVQVLPANLSDPLPDDLPVLKPLALAAMAAAPVPVLAPVTLPPIVTPPPTSAPLPPSPVVPVVVVAEVVVPEELVVTPPVAEPSIRETCMENIAAAQVADPSQVATILETVEPIINPPPSSTPPTPAPVEPATAVSQPNPTMPKKHTLPESLGRGRPHEVYYLLPGSKKPVLEKETVVLKLAHEHGADAVKVSIPSDPPKPWTTAGVYFAARIIEKSK